MHTISVSTPTTIILTGQVPCVIMRVLHPRNGRIHTQSRRIYGFNLDFDRRGSALHHFLRLWLFLFYYIHLVIITIMGNIQQIIAWVQRSYLTLFVKRLVQPDKLLMLRTWMQLKMQKVILRVLVFEQSIIREWTEVWTVPSHMFEKRRKQWQAICWIIQVYMHNYQQIMIYL